jgi:hypothetical protein
METTKASKEIAYVPTVGDTFVVVDGSKLNNIRQHYNGSIITISEVIGEIIEYENEGQVNYIGLKEFRRGIVEKLVLRIK